MEYPKFMQAMLATVAIKIDEALLKCCCQIWQRGMQPFVEEVQEFQGQFAMQYITAGVIQGAERNGSSVLGLAGKEPFIMFSAEPLWRNAADSPRVLTAVDKALSAMASEAKKRGLQHDYVYSNYASQFQDPMRSSYGEEQVLFMRNVRLKYDPEQVFQHLRGGGFKLSASVRRVDETAHL
ncbi:hypothetical protein BDV19DRAFT_390183 [Aspergillus venezuelensis]